MSTAHEYGVTLVLADEATDAEQLEEDLSYLLDEVVQLDGVAVDRPNAGAPPKGARSGVGIEMGAALIALGSSGAALPLLIGLLRDWLARRGSGTIYLKIGSDEVRLDHVPSATQREILAEFLERHRG